MATAPLSKKNFFLFLRIIVSVGILSFMVYLVRDKVDEVFNANNLVFIAVAAVIFALETAVLSLRWEFINDLFLKAPGMAETNKPKPNYSFLWYFRTAYESLALSQCLPSSFGGDAWRIFQTRSLYSSFTKATFTVLFDRLTGLIVLGLLMLLSLCFTWISLPEYVRSFFAVLLSLGAIACAVILLLWLLRGRLSHIRLPDHPLATTFRNFLSILVTPRFGDWLKIICLAALLHLMTAFALVIVAKGIGVEIPLMRSMFIAAFGLIFAIIPITFGGWGVRESAIVVAFSFFGIPSDDAISISLSFGLALLISTLPGAVLFIFRRDKTISFNGMNDD